MKKSGRKKRLIDSQVLRGTLTMSTGNVLALLITLASTPIISRLFTPEHFGIAATLLSIALLSAPLATLSYATAIQLPERASDAVRVMRITIFIAFAFAALMSVGILLSSLSFNAGFFSQFKGWEWTLPLLALLSGVQAALASFLTRLKKFKLQARSAVTGAAFTSGSRICFGIIAGSSVGVLILSYLLARVAMVAMLARGVKRLCATETTAQVPASYQTLLSNYRDFPFFATPTALLNAANKNLPLLLFGVLFSPAVAGFYAMSNRLFFRPFQLVQSSFRSVFTQHLIAATRQNRRISPMLRKACLLTASVPARIDWTRICVIRRPPDGALPDGLPGEFGSPVSPDANGHCSA